LDVLPGQPVDRMAVAVVAVAVVATVMKKNKSEKFQTEEAVRRGGLPFYVLASMVSTIRFRTSSEISLEFMSL
ncbi:MAG: hypothetical protein IJN16_11340, partial [Lachnospiraceae bacterium]|nr:hypothetical protein [Lachnospiraceae bacterium]